MKCVLGNLMLNYRKVYYRGCDLKRVRVRICVQFLHAYVPVFAFYLLRFSKLVK